MRQHHEQATIETGLGQPRFEIGQIAPHHRFDVSVHDRGRDALIFLDLRQHVAGPRDADAGHLARKLLDRGEFVDGVEVGMQEADRDRGRTGVFDGGDGVAERSRVQRRQNLATGAKPFPHAKAAFTWHQRFRRRRAQIVTVRLQAFAHLDDVAMAFGGQQRDFCPLALQQRVGRDRRAVNQPIGRSQHFRARHAQSSRQFFQARHDAERLVGRRRRRFRKHRPPGFIRGDQIGVGAADINAYSEHDQLRRSAGVPVNPCSASRWRALADRFAGGPQPPPPEERTSRQSPGRSSMPTSLVRNVRGSRPSDSRR